MNEAMTDEMLDARLREAAPYIDDGGFTTSVMKRLPARRRSRQSLRAVILIGATLFASVVTYLLSDRGHAFSEGIYRLALLPTTLLWLIALGAGVLVSVGAFVTGVSKTQELRSQILRLRNTL